MSILISTTPSKCFYQLNKWIGAPKNVGRIPLKVKSPFSIFKYLLTVLTERDSFSSPFGSLFSSKVILLRGPFFHFSSCLLVNYTLKTLIFTFTFFFFFDEFTISSSRGLKLSNFLSNSLTNSSLEVFLTLPFSAERDTFFILLRSSSFSLKFNAFFSSMRTLMITCRIHVIISF